MHSQDEAPHYQTMQYNDTYKLETIADTDMSAHQDRLAVQYMESIVEY